MTPEQLAEVLYDVRIQLENAQLLVRELSDRYQGYLQSSDPHVLSQALTIFNLRWDQHES